MSTPETPAPEPDVSVPGDAPVVPVEAAPVVEPVVVPDPAPVVAELQPVDSSGNPILPPADVVPGDALVGQPVVDVTDPPAVPVVPVEPVVEQSPPVVNVGEGTAGDVPAPEPVPAADSTVTTSGDTTTVVTTIPAPVAVSNEAEVLFRAAVRTLAADLGIVRGTVTQWVDEVYGELHGARTSALSSGAVDPFPKLAH